jgi:mRNA-capping enzyme
LIDGEMIIDKIPEVGLKRRYLAYDLMALNGVSKVKVWIKGFVVVVVVVCCV